MTGKICVLDQHTIDKIAAGEVVERPSSVVKELVENAIDAGAAAVTVEIAEGGKKLIRVTDNGSGIEADQLPTAFLSHATSKIRQVEDLQSIDSLGFRGEALSSIAAVAQVEVITKTPSALTGSRYVIEGGRAEEPEEIGAPEGTTFLVRNLFYNTPARSKFLKTDASEGADIAALVEQMALSHPDISFKFITNNQVRLYTSGSGQIQDVIYHVYGREIARALLEVHYEDEFIKIRGFAGKPEISRGNRSFENYYVNGRYVRSNILSKAIEDAYKGFLMQHKFPFAALTIRLGGEDVDVNVHPRKLEVRFANAARVYDAVFEAVREALTRREMIARVSPGSPEAAGKPSASERTAAQKDSGNEISAVEKNSGNQGNAAAGNSSGNEVSTSVGEGSGNGSSAQGRSGKYPSRGDLPEPFETHRRQTLAGQAAAQFPGEDGKPALTLQEEALFSPCSSETKSTQTYSAEAKEAAAFSSDTKEPAAFSQDSKEPAPPAPDGDAVISGRDEAAQASETSPVGVQAFDHKIREIQLNLFDEKLLDPASRNRHRLIGQLFDTYWLVEFGDRFFMIDQHAAHEKIYYERFVKAFKNREINAQLLEPPLLVTLTLPEEQLLKANMKYFEDFGFEVEDYGSREYCIRSVPAELYGFTQEELFHELLDQLSGIGQKDPEGVFAHRLATMACKAAVKGNQRLSTQEADRMIDELLKLENPYHCPHGRPTIISMTKTEIEKKFRRIV